MTKQEKREKGFLKNFWKKKSYIDIIPDFKKDRVCSKSYCRICNKSVYFKDLNTLYYSYKGEFYPEGCFVLKKGIINSQEFICDECSINKQKINEFFIKKKIKPIEIWYTGADFEGGGCSGCGKNDDKT
jgi:hypothetical protein